MTGNGSTLPGSKTQSREPNGLTGDVQASVVQHGVERETARRSQSAGDKDAQHRRKNDQPKRNNGLRNIWKPTGCGKSRKQQAKTVRVGYNRPKSSESQHRQYFRGKPYIRWHRGAMSTPKAPSNTMLQTQTPASTHRTNSETTDTDGDDDNSDEANC